VYDLVLKNTTDNLWVLGAKTLQIADNVKFSDNIKVFKSPIELLKFI
jgi:hypothetical protein